jgi:acyl carrier protein
MNKDMALEIVTSTIKNDLELNHASSDISTNTPIIGSDSPIDSMGLVQLCLSLEEKAEELGFEFDWTTESAMSRSRGMFRSVESLSDEFVSQYNEKNDNSIRC